MQCVDLGGRRIIKKGGIYDWHETVSTHNRQKCTRTFFQAEDGIRDVERSRGLGDVYKRQVCVHIDIDHYICIDNLNILFSCSCPVALAYRVTNQ